MILPTMHERSGSRDANLAIAAAAAAEAEVEEDRRRLDEEAVEVEVEVEEVMGVAAPVHQQCAICVEPLGTSSGGQVAELMCGHRFCRGCLAEMRKKRSHSCPMCRFKGVNNREVMRAEPSAAERAQRRGLVERAPPRASYVTIVYTVSSGQNNCMHTLAQVYYFEIILK